MTRRNKTFLKLLPLGAYTDDRIKEIQEEVLKREKSAEVKKINMTKRRKRYSCCEGSVKCSLNSIERKIDTALRIYRKNPRRGRRVFMNWILDIDESRDWWEFKAKELLKEKRKSQ